jgi:hypothetical protein
MAAFFHFPNQMLATSQQEISAVFMQNSAQSGINLNFSKMDILLHAVFCGKETEMDVT